MKKIFSILMIACVAMLFASCHKDGVYKPSKKISKIYYTSNSGNKSLDQIWTWNKDNTLNKIDYYENGAIDYTYNFTYEKKRLVRVDEYADNEHVEYKYDGNKLKEVDAYYGNTLEVTYAFTYQNSKISTIVLTPYYNKSDNAKRIYPMQFIFPDGLAKQMEKAEQKCMAKSGKDNYTITYTLTWDKNNITKVVMSESYMGEYYGTTAEVQYDNKKNPFYGFMSFYVGEDISNGNYSSNNYTKISLRDNDGEYEEQNYQYTYDGQYPISRRYLGNGSTNLYEFEYTK